LSLNAVYIQPMTSYPFHVL